MSEDNNFDLSEWEQASTKKMISFSLGYVITATFANRILFYYYEVEIGLPVALLALGFIFFSIWNMINDPLVAYLTDRPFKWTRKWGMRFPWILIGAIPASIFYFLVYISPNADPNNPWPVFWWFMIMTCVADTFFSIYTTHINAAYTNHFRTDAERRKAVAIMNFLGATLALFYGFIGPLVIVYGKKETFILAALIGLIVQIILIILLIPGIRESEDLKERFLRGYENNQKEKSESFWKIMKKAFGRKNFIATFFVFFLLSLAGILYSTSGIYFMKDVLRLPLYYYIYILIVWFLGFVLFIPFWMNRVRKYGAYKVMKISLIIGFIGYLPLLWITTIEQVIIFAFIAGTGLGAFTFSLAPVVADVNDECTVMDGKHQEGKYGGIRTCFFRFSLILQAVIFTIVHLLTGYNPNPNAVQTPLAIWGIRIIIGLIPSLLCLVSFIIMHKWYDLEGEKKLAIKQKLRELGL